MNEVRPLRKREREREREEIVIKLLGKCNLTMSV